MPPEQQQHLQDKSLRHLRKLTFFFVVVWLVKKNWGYSPYNSNGKLRWNPLDNLCRWIPFKLNFSFFTFGWIGSSFWWFGKKLKKAGKTQSFNLLLLGSPKNFLRSQAKATSFLGIFRVIQTWHGKDGTPTNFFMRLVRWCNTPMKMAPQKNRGWVITITPIKWALCGPPFITSFWGHPSRLGFNGPTYHWGMFAPQSQPPLENAMGGIHGSN